LACVALVESEGGFDECVDMLSRLMASFALCAASSLATYLEDCR
jgi:hypothetical protein